MRIGVDIRALMDKYYSGVSEYTANLLKSLLQIDKENQYKLFFNSWKPQLNRLGIWQGDNAQLYFSRYPNKIFNYLLQRFLKRPKLDKFIGGADIFWSPHFNFTKTSPEARKVITIHDLSFLRYPEFFSVRKNFWHRALEIKKTIQEADLIVAISENTKNDLIELLGVRMERIKVIYSGNNKFNNDFSDEDRLTYLKKNNLKAPFILYLGTIEPRKNLVGLINAYNLFRGNNPGLANYRLVLAGANGWKNREIYKAAKRSPYHKDIIFLGYVDQRDKEMLYKSARLFVFPSFYEGFGFPPLEVMSAGLPVVCSNVSSLPEVVADAAILVDPFNIPELASVIEEILVDEELRKGLTQKGLARAQQFSWDKTASAYLNAFKELHHEKDK